jgi:guanine deaminase
MTNLYYNSRAMQLAVDQARITMEQNIGGPFGAAIVKDGKIIKITSNRVLKDNDPTAHAEILAIREACEMLDTYDLSGCELYATGYPCPMCLGAIIWANIKTVYVSGFPKDAEKIGFRDDYIYKYILEGRKDPDVLDIILVDREPAKMLYKEYAERNKIIY